MSTSNAASFATPGIVDNNGHVARMEILADLVWDIRKKKPTVYQLLTEPETRRNLQPLSGEDAILSFDKSVEVELKYPSAQSTDPAQLQMPVLNLRNYPDYAKRKQTYKDMPVMPANTERIVILDQYQHIYTQADELNMRYQKAKDRDGPQLKRHLVVTGMPGVGKSYAQSVLLFWRLARGLPTAIQPFWVYGQGFFFFHANGVEWCPRGQLTHFVEMYRRDTTVWVLADEDPLPDFQSIWCKDWLVIWSASPGRFERSRFQKENNAEVWYIGPWTWQNLLFAEPDILQGNDLKKLRFLYGRYGGVPRVLFNTVGLGREDSKADWLTSLDHYDRLVRTRVKRILSDRSGPKEVLDDVLADTTNFKIFTLIPDPNLRSPGFSRGFTPEVSTAYIIECLQQALLREAEEKRREYFQRVMSVPEMRTAGGRYFENLVHRQFETSSTAFCDRRRKPARAFSLGSPLGAPGPLGSSDAFGLKRFEAFNSLDQILLKNFRSQQVRREELAVYYKTNLAAIDSFVVLQKNANPNRKTAPVTTITVLFQITVAEKHSIKAKGVNDVLRILPAQGRKNLVFVFVTPHDSKLKTAQNLVGDLDTTLAPNVTLHQRVLRLEESELFPEYVYRS